MNTEALLDDLGVPHVLVAASVEEALRHVEGESFGLAILDLQLGEAEDSLPVAARLVELGIPFVFATGFGEGRQLIDGQGAFAVLKKPYRGEDLQAILDSGFGRRGHG